MASGAWNLRYSSSGWKYTKSWDSAMTVGLISWKYLGPMGLVQSTLFAFKCIDCNLGDNFRLFILFCHSGRNGISSRITAPAQDLGANHLVPEEFH